MLTQSQDRTGHLPRQRPVWRDTNSPDGMDEPLYKKIKLALERPYKDEDGIPIPVLLDINPDGEHIYESSASRSSSSLTG